ncbi:hypothetical protein [Pseudomonas sp. Q1-7]|uniref:hypothetical protein n=1 Tax=Pseudomonas sp. Q1-7 TaxID=3020843 RepID=UPI0023000E78|nr:hypothetical protein [Pseudomonas sp. Q1-7]
MDDPAREQWHGPGLLRLFLIELELCPLSELRVLMSRCLIERFFGASWTAQASGNAVDLWE